MLGRGEWEVDEGGKGCFNGNTKGLSEGIGLTGVEGRSGKSESTLVVEQKGGLSETEAIASVNGSCESATIFGSTNSSTNKNTTLNI